MEAVEREADRLGADQGRGATIAEKQEGQQTVEVLRLLQMQSAEFETDDQNFRLGRRAHDMPRELQGIDRRMAAHEADDGALDGRRKAAAAHDFEVHARRGKAGACRNDEMRDLLRLGTELEPIDRLGAENRRFRLISAHALRRRRKLAEPIEAFAVERIIGARPRRREAGPAPLDLRARHHPLEQQARIAIAQQIPGEAHECVVHFVVGNGGCDTIKINLLHAGYSL